MTDVGIHAAKFSEAFHAVISSYGPSCLVGCMCFCSDWMVFLVLSTCSGF